LENKDFLESSGRLNDPKVKEKLDLDAAHKKVDIEEKDSVDFLENLIDLNRYELFINVPDNIEISQY